MSIFLFTNPVSIIINECVIQNKVNGLIFLNGKAQSDTGRICSLNDRFQNT